MRQPGTHTYPDCFFAGSDKDFGTLAVKICGQLVRGLVIRHLLVVGCHCGLVHNPLAFDRFGNLSCLRGARKKRC